MKIIAKQIKWFDDSGYSHKSTQHETGNGMASTNQEYYVTLAIDMSIYFLVRKPSITSKHSTDATHLLTVPFPEYKS